MINTLRHFSENLKHEIKFGRLKTQILAELDMGNFVQVLVDPRSRYLEPFGNLADSQKLFIHERLPATVHNLRQLAAHPPGRVAPTESHHAVRLGTLRVIDGKPD
jgi:hypothetical protein